MMKKLKYLNYPLTRTISLFLLAICLIHLNCSESEIKPKTTFKYAAPEYNLVELNTASDTISFKLDEFTYNNIRSFNIFSQDSSEYLSFLDDRSATVCIYNFQSQNIIKSIQLKKILKGHKLYKTSTYVKNFDSIFITNNKALYMMDSTGKIKKRVRFLEKPENSYAVLENTNPPIFKGKDLFTGVRPYVKETSYKALREWKVIYKFDLDTRKADLCYHLPEFYQKNLLGFHFLDYSYCQNAKGNFIFSFPADTTIYETDLTNYSIAYLGKSKHQRENIRPATAKMLKDTDKNLENYILQDSYGPVFYDSHNRKYLRVVKLKISKHDFNLNQRKRKYHFLILDDDFKIIGESPIDEGLAYNSILFTQAGRIYARTKLDDEYAIHFVQLKYTVRDKINRKLAQNENDKSNQ